MKVYFSHGKESGPWGSKIKRLADIATEHGCSVESIDYRDLKDEPDRRVERLLKVLEKETDEVVLVGSSMGGYVSLVAAETVKPKGVFLLAPALYMPGYNKQEYSARSNIDIVHGWSDEIIPVEHSIRFARTADCSLHLIAGNHRLDSSLDVVARLFTRFLDSCK